MPSMPPRQPPRRPPDGRPTRVRAVPRAARPRRRPAAARRSSRAPTRPPGSDQAGTGIRSCSRVVGVGLLVGRGRLRRRLARLVGLPPGARSASGAAAAAGAEPDSRRLRRAAARPTPAASRHGRHPTARGPGDLPLALVADVRDLREGLTVAQLAKELAAGRVAIPCGLDELDPRRRAPWPSTPAPASRPAEITTAVRARKPRLGPPSRRARDAAGEGAPDRRRGPLRGALASARSRTRCRPGSADPPAAWTGFDPAEVRTIISTGETCPDRGVSYWANTQEEGLGLGPRRRHGPLHRDRHRPPLRRPGRQRLAGRQGGPQRQRRAPCGR